MGQILSTESLMSILSEARPPDLDARTTGQSAGIRCRAGFGGFVTICLLASIHAYQKLRAGRPTGCRYLPTCSSYAEEAIVTHGPVHGSGLALRRLSRCHPWGSHGIDPVPERSPK